jgi:Rps23 Pro-64 3,4-dihydroxylase Tpa1-like proline 4-hydroxylase
VRQWLTPQPPTAVTKLWPVLSINVFAKLSTAKSASFDDIRKRNLHLHEDIIFVIKSASQTN